MKISLICRNIHPQVFYQVGVLKNFAQFTGRYQCWSFFPNELQDGGLKPATLLKKNSSAGGSFQNFEEYFFYRTAVDDCFWIYQNINCQNVSVSQLIISKSYKRWGEQGEVNHSSLHASIIKVALQGKGYLCHVIKSSTVVALGFAQNINIFILQKVP